MSETTVTNLVNVDIELTMYANGNGDIWVSIDHLGKRIASTLVHPEVLRVMVDEVAPVQEDALTDGAIKSLVAKHERVIARKIREAYSRDPRPSTLRLAAAVFQGLTEKPRPEGAVELETVIGLNAGKWTSGAEDVRALADLLAENGVRVTGGHP